MKIANFLARGVAGVWVLSLFAMCTKAPLKIEKPLSATSVTTTSKDSTIVSQQSNQGSDTSYPDTSVAVRHVFSVTDVDYTVQPNQWYVDGTGIAPGTVIAIPAGTRSALLLKNLKGTPDNPIIITNIGGKSTIATAASASYALKTQNCRYIKILGNGDDAYKYGIEINGGNLGVTLDDLTSDFEIANLEVHHSGFAGIMAKTDPSCDPLTWRGNFTMSNISIHHNYVHDTGGEGLYVGNSFYEDGLERACGTLMPHDVKNLMIYSNTTKATGCEGIQVGSATANCLVYHNTVLSPGVSPFASAQNNGIQIGEGTGGKCYNNLIKDAPGNGIIVLGLGDNTIFNNIILNAGQHGIFADSRYTPGPYFRFYNNIIISPDGDGIKLNSETIPMNVVVNNVIIQPGSALAIHKMNSDVKVTASNNYVSDDLNSCRFVNPAANDFHLQASSPLIGTGLNVYTTGVAYDYYSSKRSVAGAFDIGAVKY